MATVMRAVGSILGLLLLQSATILSLRLPLTINTIYQDEITYEPQSMVFINMDPQFYLETTLGDVINKLAISPRTQVDINLAGLVILFLSAKVDHLKVDNKGISKWSINVTAHDLVNASATLTLPLNETYKLGTIQEAMFNILEQKFQFTKDDLMNTLNMTKDEIYTALEPDWIKIVNVITQKNVLALSQAYDIPPFYIAEALNMTENELYNSTLPELEDILQNKIEIIKAAAERLKKATSTQGLTTTFVSTTNPAVPPWSTNVSNWTPSSTIHAIPSTSSTAYGTSLMIKSATRTMNGTIQATSAEESTIQVMTNTLAVLSASYPGSANTAAINSTTAANATATSTRQGTLLQVNSFTTTNKSTTPVTSSTDKLQGILSTEHSTMQPIHSTASHVQSKSLLLTDASTTITLSNRSATGNGSTSVLNILGETTMLSGHSTMQPITTTTLIGKVDQSIVSLLRNSTATIVKSTTGERTSPGDSAVRPSSPITTQQGATTISSSSTDAKVMSSKKINNLSLTLDTTIQPVTNKTMSVQKTSNIVGTVDGTIQLITSSTTAGLRGSMQPTSSNTLSVQRSITSKTSTVPQANSSTIITAAKTGTVSVLEQATLTVRKSNMMTLTPNTTTMVTPSSTTELHKNSTSVKQSSGPSKIVTSNTSPKTTVTQNMNYNRTISSKFANNQITTSTKSAPVVSSLSSLTNKPSQKTPSTPTVLTRHVGVTSSVIEKISPISVPSLRSTISSKVVSATTSHPPILSSSETNAPVSMYSTPFVTTTHVSTTTTPKTAVLNSPTTMVTSSYTESGVKSGSTTSIKYASWKNPRSTMLSSDIVSTQKSKIDPTGDTISKSSVHKSSTPPVPTVIGVSDKRERDEFDPVVFIIVPLVALLVLAALIVGLVLCWRRRKQILREKQNNRGLGSELSEKHLVKSLEDINRGRSTGFVNRGIEERPSRSMSRTSSVSNLETIHEACEPAEPEIYDL